jgi:Flp pilus assembly protein TadB
MMDFAALFPWLLFLVFLPAAAFGVGYFIRLATIRFTKRRRIEHLKARHARHSQETGLATLIDQELNARGLVPTIKRLVFGRQELREFGMIMSFEQVLEVAGLPKWLRNLLFRSQIDTEFGEIIKMTLVYWAVVSGTALVLAEWTPGLFMLIALGLPIAFFFVLMRRAARYRSEVLQQLPGALDFISRGLRAGHPLVAALRQAGTQLEDPIAKEFNLVRIEVDFGRPVGGALIHMAERVGGREIRIFAVAAQINMQAGGNLAEALDNLSGMLRERVLIQKKIRSITAEGRFSAYLMAAFPFILYGAFTLITPTYFDAFWASEAWKWLVPVFFALLVTGTIIVFRMTKI